MIFGFGKPKECNAANELCKAREANAAAVDALVKEAKSLASDLARSPVGFAAKDRRTEG